MPQKRNNTEPPPVMTWGKALPILIIAAIFDALRIMCEQFWFFGPLLTAFYCTAKVSGVLGTTVGGALCGVAATAAGVVGAGPLEVFGIVMAMAVGLFGWLTLLLLLMLMNGRIFKENAGNAIWFAASLLVSEAPLIGTIPAFIGITWRLYSTQIKNDKEALLKYEQQREAEQLQERNQQTAQLMQVRAAQQAQIEQQEAANEAVYAEAANDEQYNETATTEEIPEEERRAA